MVRGIELLLDRECAYCDKFTPDVERLDITPLEAERPMCLTYIRCENRVSCNYMDLSHPLGYLPEACGTIVNELSRHEWFYDAFKASMQNAISLHPDDPDGQVEEIMKVVSGE